MTNGLETVHSPFPFSSAFMRTFGPVVRVLSRVMERIGHHVAMGRTVASQFIGHESSRRLALSLEESSKEAGRSFCIATRLEQDIQDLTVLIHGSIEISHMTTDANKDFIDEPLITAGCGPFTKPIGIGWTKSNTLTPDRLVRYIDPALGEQIFDIAIAQAESVVQPYGVANDFFCKAAAMIQRFSGFHSASVANRQLA